MRLLTIGGHTSFAGRIPFLEPEARKLTERGLEEMLADLYDADMDTSDTREGSPHPSARCSGGARR